jgi:hypothetical protein
MPTGCLNSAFLADFSVRTDRWQAPLADLLRSDRDIQASLLDYNTKLLDELEIAHMALNVRGNLVAMIINERQPGQSCLPEPGKLLKKRWQER